MNDNIKLFKARLVAKGYTQNDGIDYKETFSPVSKKDSLRIIMALLARYYLELYQMNVKTTFLNGKIKEEIYMDQLEGFSMEGKDHMVCKRKKSIYELKQASKQWYLKFSETITSFDFHENIVNRCICPKISGSKFIFFVLYVDDILLVANDLGILYEIKKFISKNFEMKDMGEAFYVIGISIFEKRSHGLLGLSHKAYIEKILEKFNMNNCSIGIVLIQKRDKFSLMQCPKNDVERKQMESTPYAYVVSSFNLFATRPYISFVVGILSQDHSNPGIDHWKAVKKVIRYLQGTKDYKLTLGDLIN